jgi:hypothetical protein
MCRRCDNGEALVGAETGVNAEDGPAGSGEGSEKRRRRWRVREGEGENVDVAADGAEDDDKTAVGGAE